MALNPLFEPLHLGSISLRNRIIMSALTRNRSVPTNVPNEINVEYYQQRAAGHAALIVTEGVLISQQGTEWQYAPGIWSEEQVVAWKKVTDTVHSVDGIVFAQLWHVGRIAHPDAPEQKASGLPVYAPSAISARGGKFRFLPGKPGYTTPTAVKDPEVLIAQFKHAAINAMTAGFDGVELHGANGYLVHQFLDSTSNLRTDKWGGNIENRARFGLETLKVLIEVFGADRVGIRLTPAGGYNDMGMPLQETLDTYSYFIQEADKLKLAYITLIRAGTLDVEIDGKMRATQHDVLSSYAPLIKHAKIFLNGGVTPQEGAALISSGKIHAVVFGFLWIGHPDLAKRLYDGIHLDAQVDTTMLYGHGGEMAAQRKGYTDYPTGTVQ